ncbi:MAG: hypothetical protein ACOY90_01610 [Candidatus Zhuqueibacterota bacterium]
MKFLITFPKVSGECPVSSRDNGRFTDGALMFPQHGFERRGTCRKNLLHHKKKIFTLTSKKTD